MLGHLQVKKKTGSYKRRRNTLAFKTTHLWVQRLMEAGE